jgi:dihydroxyacid dehydratase/phosphogluconate dehydratase
VKQGVRDMVRISDARMSGTSYGACILHVSPESYIGGPLALVKTGDIIDLDIPARTINMRSVRRRTGRAAAAWKPPKPRYERGYGWMFSRTSSRPTRAAISTSSKPISARRSAEPAIF